MAVETVNPWGERRWNGAGVKACREWSEAEGPESLDAGAMEPERVQVSQQRVV